MRERVRESQDQERERGRGRQLMRTVNRVTEEVNRDMVVHAWHHVYLLPPTYTAPLTLVNGTLHVYTSPGHSPLVQGAGGMVYTSQYKNMCIAHQLSFA